LWEFEPFFKISEFDSPDEPGSGIKMSYMFMLKLCSLRRFVDRKFIINSGYRTKEYNENLISRGYKASLDSAHLDGIAADIACPDSAFRYKFLEGCFKYEIHRIGSSENFFHIDIDTNKPQKIIWTYPD